MMIDDRIESMARAGITRGGIEASIGRRLKPDEARHVREIKAAAAAAADHKQRSGAANRQRKHRTAARDIGELPPVAHPWRRMLCAYSLARFGREYGMERTDLMDPLLMRPPSERMMRFIMALQIRILRGGLKHVRWPRGTGKSTWVKVAIMWAVLYGYRRFILLVARTKAMAAVMADEIWRRIASTPAIVADFPELAVAMRDLQDVSQRSRFQTYHGVLTGARMDESRFFYFRFPTLAGFPSTGAMLAYRGADQALRGLNIDSRRPDFVFVDDPQKDEDARSPGKVLKVEQNICGAILGTGDVASRISAVMASTPIECDDVSERFADPKLHPEWECETERLVRSFGDMQLVAEYLRRLSINGLDAAGEWYAANRAAIECGAEVFDESCYDPAIECSAYQHALWLLWTMKDRFYSECQMIPSRSQNIYHISAALVRSRVNGVAFGRVPAECDQGMLAFVDVNAVAGLRWEIGAFGRGRVVAVMAYGQYPAPGMRLYPENTPEAAIPVYLANGLEAVFRALAAVRFTTADGAAANVRAVCVDGGWQTATVALMVSQLNSRGMAAIYSRGYDSRGYSRYHHEQAARDRNLLAGEECHTWWTQTGNAAAGQYLAFNADYWREVAQSSFIPAPLSPSSSSLYGDRPEAHDQFASEIVAEELRAKEFSTRYGNIYTWHKDRSRPNHFGDSHTGLLAFGAIRGNYDGVARAIEAAHDASETTTKEGNTK